MNEQPSGGLPTTEYWYSCQPFLAWCVNHYFYGGKHYAYLARPFHPYREKNPRSSNPLRIYESLYEAWRDRDPFDNQVVGLRLRLQAGLDAHETMLGTVRYTLLTEIVQRIGVEYFLPIVYRVDIKPIDEARLLRQGSGLSGSREYVVTDLGEDEFGVLFSDVDERFRIRGDRYALKYWKAVMGSFLDILYGRVFPPPQPPRAQVVDVFAELAAGDLREDEVLGILWEAQDFRLVDSSC